MCIEVRQVNAGLMLSGKMNEIKSKKGGGRRKTKKMRGEERRGKSLVD